MNKEQAFLLVVLVVAGMVSFLILLPLLEFVLLAVILAYILHPLNVRLEAYVGWRLAPFLVIVLGGVAIGLPLLYAGLVIYRDLVRLAAAEPGLDVTAIEEWIVSLTGQRIGLDAILEAIGTDLLRVLFGDITELVSALVFVAIGIAVVFFLMYYLLRDGDAFVAWLIHVAPAQDAICFRLVDQIDRTTHGVIVGHLFVAVVQGAIGGVGFWIAGLPNVAFWAFVMGVLSLLPLIGLFMVWAPAAGYLFLVDELWPAIFLALWGALVISMVDNYARPIVIDRDAHLNPAVILIGVFGGIYAIGLTGLFVGPIVLGVLAAALRVFDEEWDRIGTTPG